jgi:PAS domain S-box-containing protein
MLQHSDAVDPLGRDARHQQFGALLEFSPDAIVIVDPDGLVRECNPAAERMLQTTSEAGANAPLRELLCAAHRVIFDIAWLQLLAGHAVPRATALPEFVVGSEPPLDVTVAPVLVGETLAGAVVILRDATGHTPHGPEPSRGPRPFGSRVNNLRPSMRNSTGPQACRGAAGSRGTSRNLRPRGWIGASLSSTSTHSTW